MSDSEMMNSERKQRGRGFQKRKPEDAVSTMAMDSEAKAGTQSCGIYQSSVEGWIIFVRGIHEEAAEDTISDIFAEYGAIKDIHLNLDRRTGFVKGYALIEYNDFEEAEAAVKAMNGEEILGKKVECDFAFLRGPLRT